MTGCALLFLTLFVLHIGHFEPRQARPRPPHSLSPAVAEALDAGQEKPCRVGPSHLEILLPKSGFFYRGPENPPRV